MSDPRDQTSGPQPAAVGFLDRLPDGVACAEGDRIRYANPALAALLGFERAADLVGLELASLIPPAKRTATAAALAQIEEARLFEGVLLGRGGEPIPVEVNARSLVVEGRGVLVGVVRDLSQRREAEARLLQGDRVAALGTLAAGMAHSMNNPLGWIMGNLGFLAGELEDLIEGGLRLAEPSTRVRLDEMREALGEAMEGAERLHRTIDDLLTFSRARDDVHEPVDVGQVLEIALRLTENELRHSGRLELDLDPDLPPVAAPPGRLGQVFVHLLVNAAQAMESGHAEFNELRVVARSVGDEVTVSFSDTGTGIPPEVRGRLFDPFFTTRAVGVGSGLGLSISHGIVESLGGRIEVESVEGSGSTFRVHLPVAREPADAAEAPSAPSATGPALAHPGRVLVVDDEPLVGASVRRILGRRGHEVVVETSALRAFSRLGAGERFDLVLCDLMMPDMNGMELWDSVSEEVRARMVFVTGGAFTARAQAFLEEGDHPFVRKPFDAQGLLELVARYVAS